jgi:hypothetical protein
MEEASADSEAFSVVIRTTENLRVNKLNILPNINAIRVDVMIITLYGMLKSGVATSTRRTGVYIRWRI